MSTPPNFDRRQMSGAPAKPGAGSPIPLVRANAFAPFVGFLNEIGAPLERLLCKARMPPVLFDDPEALLPVMSGYRFAELAARQEKIEDLGVVIGRRASSFDLGVFGALLRETSTVYEYLKTGVRLIGGYSGGTRLWLTPESGALRLNQYLTGPPSPGRCIADLYTLVLTVNTLRQLLGPTWSPPEVCLMAGNEKLHGDCGVFGSAQLITGQSHSSFTIPRSVMQMSMPPWHDKSMSGRDTGLAGQRMPTDFKASAEQLIASLLTDGYPPIESAADAAGMSSRTLQRRLAEAGTSYSGLVSDTRLRMAKAWLTDSDMPVAEIAATLGYNEATNFARAFRRQTGTSPAAYRRGQA